MRPIVFAGMLLMFSSATWADDDDEIVTGCHFSMAEFGVEAIQICIKDNRAARAAVLQYPDEVREIVVRCSHGKEVKGWWAVKMCIDKDIEAEAALANYGREHHSSMEKCKAEFGHRGAARIKA